MALFRSHFFAGPAAENCRGGDSQGATGQWGACRSAAFCLTPASPSQHYAGGGDIRTFCLNELALLYRRLALGTLPPHVSFPTCAMASVPDSGDLPLPPAWQMQPSLVCYVPQAICLLVSLLFRKHSS